MFIFCGFGWILGYILIVKILYEKGICFDFIGCYDCKILFSNMIKKYYMIDLKVLIIGIIVFFV